MIIPRLKTAVTHPQAAAVYPCCVSPRGPRTWNGAMTMQRTRQARSNIAHSQVRERTSRQPLRSSATKLCVARLLASVGGRTPARKAALTKKVAASTAIAPPAPTTATSVPATAGPTIQPKLSLMPMSAFALCRLAPGTICGSSAPAEGRKKASAPPCTAASSASCHTCAAPLRSSTAVTAWTVARVRSLATMTFCRGRRSAHTPPTRARAASGRLWAARTRPRSVPDPVRPSTANVRATGVMPSPNTDTD